jgi:hypothetical protein
MAAIGQQNVTPNGRRGALETDEGARVEHHGFHAAGRPPGRLVRVRVFNALTTTLRGKPSARYRCGYLDSSSSATS